MTQNQHIYIYMYIYTLMWLEQKRRSTVPLILAAATRRTDVCFELCVFFFFSILFLDLFNTERANRSFQGFHKQAEEPGKQGCGRVFVGQYLVGMFDVFFRCMGSVALLRYPCDFVFTETRPLGAENWRTG